MNREIESHFSMLPQVDVKRSKMKRPTTHKTAFMTGDLVPLYVDSDILPGDTVSMDMGSIVRMSTPIAPVMDNALMDIFWFFVPHRLVWQHFKEFWGENNTTYWEQTTEYETPQIEAPSGGWAVNSLADYMGLPIGKAMSVSHLPFRAYCKCVNDWFVDENLKDPCMFTMDETTVTGVNKGLGYDYVTDIEKGAACFKAAKFHDYFTSALPAPQKGPAVTIPIGLEGMAPVIPSKTDIPWDTVMKNYDSTEIPLVKVGKINPAGLTDWDSAPNGKIKTYSGSLLVHEETPEASNNADIGFKNMYADLASVGLSGAVATINELRNAIAVQEFYEAQARGGSRYIEFIKSIFGVTSPDARLQRSEYLGGTRYRINMDQVLQTSATDTVSPQGNTAAFSATTFSGNMFTHSFVEHGTLLCLGVVRTDHTYQQGIERMWSRKKWYEYYVPQFANLGEQEIKVKELYAQGTSDDEETFGYQEAWADYRYKPSRISGELRSTAPQPLDIWHYGDNYTQRPYLSSEWIDEVESNVARTLAVTSEIQFIGDFYFDATYVRPMPVYSIPAMLHM